MNEKTPTQQVSEWLADLDAALERGDAEGATALFGDDSYWRDLTAFTWNITTAEGNAGESIPYGGHGKVNPAATRIIWTCLSSRPILCTECR